MNKRKIKFRAWDIINKKWHVWHGFKSVLDGSIFCEIGDKDDDLIYLQFTGAKDKDDKEIYDGDIIEGEFENEFGSVTKDRSEIGWCEHSNNWAIFPSKEKGAEHFMLVQTKELKVIGNVFENPELLK